MTQRPLRPHVDEARYAAPAVLTPQSPGVDGPRLKVYAAPPLGKPEVRIRDPLHAHLADVGAIEQYITLPDEWNAVRDRWASFVGTADPMRDRLAQAVVNGGGDIDALRALAIAEIDATTETEAELRRIVGARVNVVLVEAYKPVAGRVYNHIAGLFDDAANHRDDDALDELLPVLVASARLCGADPDVGQYAVHHLGLVLAVDPKRAHRRRLVEVFSDWSAIRELGAEVVANPDPLAQPWQLPALIRCFDADHRLVDHDPLDGPLPKGWTGSVDGWLDDGPAWRQ